MPFDLLVTRWPGPTSVCLLLVRCRLPASSKQQATTWHAQKALLSFARICLARVQDRCTLAIMQLPAWLKTSRIASLVVTIEFLLIGAAVNVLEIIAFVLVRPFSVHLFRRVNAFFVYLHWSVIPWLIENWCDLECRVYGDFEEARGTVHRKKAMVVLNHKGDCDWMLGFCLCDRLAALSNAKCLMKSFVKYLPPIGVQFYFSDFAFLTRSWSRDCDHLTAMAKTWSSYRSPFALCVFAEGTRYTKEKHEANLIYARENGLPELKHLLLPRTKGFTFLMKQLKDSIDVLYDITIVCRGLIPSAMDILKGRKIKADFFMRKIPVEDVPIGSDEETAKWLVDLYKSKDELLEHHSQNDAFPGPECFAPRRIYPRLIVFIWSVLMFVPFAAYTTHLIAIEAYFTLGIIAVFLLAAEAAMRLIVKVALANKPKRK
ncbi:1-acyl-sn-glycerol-3-phosphate acyltransferase gamma-like [Oscarella lobularis]|uniref:1-acyl-sn-glycerol-3-phosphate acyltransferase gamma-like n=1 Tax=Oscarella lobularis TaxID=121494 RepID=UPI0033139DEF